MNNTLQYPGFHVGKCCQYLLDNTSKTPIENIVSGLKEGNINIKGYPSNIIDCHTKNYLETIGFRLVKSLDTEDKRLNYCAAIGDIAIMYQPIGDDGHICMWTGDCWVGKSKQSDISIYKNMGNNLKTIWIYRWDDHKWIEEQNKSQFLIK